MNMDPNGAVPGTGSIVGATSPKAAPQGGAAPEVAEAQGAAFRALLERLEKTAKDLDDASASLEDPRELGKAVESARVSVEQAVLMGSDLLEAYRAAQAAPPETNQALSSNALVHESETHPERPRTGLGETQ